MKNKLFGMFLLLIGLSATAGCYGLVFMNGLGLPVAALAGSPFNSYVGPGLLLGFVGIVHMKASYLMFTNNRLAFEGGAVAGLGMMLYEFFEIYIIRQPHVLQIVYFFVGLITVVIAGLKFRGPLYSKHQ